MTIDYDNEDNNKALFYLTYTKGGFSKLKDIGKEISVPANTEINVLDETPDCCYLLISGRVVCYDLSEDGFQRIYNILEPNSLILEECLLFRWPCRVIFRTAKDSVLVRLERCDLVRLFKHDIDATLEFSRYQSMKFLSTMELQRLSHHRSAEWQVCRLLQAFMERYGEPYDGKILIRESITQQMIGDILGINRVTITRIFHNLREEFLERINGYYCIRSREKLEDYIRSIE